MIDINLIPVRDAVAVGIGIRPTGAGICGRNVDVGARLVQVWDSISVSIKDYACEAKPCLLSEYGGLFKASA